MEILEKEILEILEKSKMKNILTFNLDGKSPLVKKLIVGTYPNEKNCRNIALEIKNQLELLVEKDINIEGEFPAEWVVLDLGDIVVELFTEEKRTYYNLEKLWGDVKSKLTNVKQKKK